MKMGLCWLGGDLVKCRYGCFKNEAMRVLGRQKHHNALESNH